MKYAGNSKVGCDRLWFTKVMKVKEWNQKEIKQFTFGQQLKETKKENSLNFADITELAGGILFADWQKHHSSVTRWAEKHHSSVTKRAEKSHDTSKKIFVSI